MRLDESAMSPRRTSAQIRARCASWLWFASRLASMILSHCKRYWDGREFIDELMTQDAGLPF